MRTAVTLLTMLATVFHFTVGCCLHASHAGDAATCCHDDHAACHAGDGCDGSHDHESPPHRPDPQEPGPGDIHGEHFPESAAHACDGCRCSVTVEAKPVDDVSPAPAWPGPALGADSIATSQAARGPCDTAAVPVLSALRPPLFERLLI